ncbi:A24 family peptidase [Caballeronia sordidicola]|uniref:Type IV prepilin peptidase TadV/CpaA n=1 Tax=Caballeronia sordidicola TaxID=196367 RepID=A0A242N6I6_CABSO|nr:prepilin peptidase [Caballeronia sordidicola]OTP79290.1 Type IV prepilin peptidase TadV/CpaA [Caballeronia sordidicola]
MQTLSLVIRLAVLVALLSLAVVDVRERRLPTRQVLIIGALFYVDALVMRMPIAAVLGHTLIALAAFAVCALLFALKMLGGGDAKLASIVFLWAGAPLWLPALMLISVIGTAVSLVSLATRRINPHRRTRLAAALALFSGARGVPYGVALALGGGTVIVLPAALPLFLSR